ncbi:MAG: DNA repair protein RadA [Paracoccaceae bacterium]
MVKAQIRYLCRSCGAVHAKWAGQCASCGAWNSLEADEGLSAASPATKGLGRKRGRAVALEGLSGGGAAPVRAVSGMAELDRALGGGLVPGSALLVSGDPGIGKSTLLLQAAAAFAERGVETVYLSGEEAAEQVRMRAGRLGLSDAPVKLAAETNLRDILTTLEAARPGLVVVDSIQTLWLDQVEAVPGSISQVRAAAHELTAFAKRHGIAVVMVGHITKDGQIAGPRVVEHMVDTVLHFEGERGHQFRILRAVKNRFGPADEIGVFEMTAGGLAEVANPSALFLGERGTPSPGSAVFAGIEGTRPVLVEFQALVAPSPLATPRRAVIGWDSGRLSMLLAVLETRAGVSFSGAEVYLNVAGGLRIAEPAADLAAAAALLSALTGEALPDGAVFFGEASLSGALRPVAQTKARLKEAAKLGFTAAFAPAQSAQAAGAHESAMDLRRVGDLPGLVAELFGARAA